MTKHRSVRGKEKTKRIEKKKGIKSDLFQEEGGEGVFANLTKAGLSDTSSTFRKGEKRTGGASGGSQKKRGGITA